MPFQTHNPHDTMHISILQGPKRINNPLEVSKYEVPYNLVELTWNLGPSEWELSQSHELCKEG